MTVENELLLKAIKHDKNKPRWDLLPFDALEALVDVYTIGARKYADRNWEKGMSWMRVLGAMLRHTWKFIRGERYDPEDGQHHLASVAWCALAVLAYDLRGMREYDDRPLAAFFQESKNER